MLKNYVKIFLRNLKKQKIYSIINIIGLAIGITFFILLISYVWDELTYDRFHANADKIYRVTADFGPGVRSSTPPIFAGALKTEFPDVLQTTRLWERRQAIKYGNKMFHQNVAFADPEFFELFTFPLKAGNPSQALNNPNKVILTQEMAHKYFGDNDPLSKILSINIEQENRDFIVSGVLEEIPGNSSIKFDLLIPFQNVSLVFGQDFEASLVTTPFFHSTFIEMADDSHPSSITNRFTAFIEKYYGENIRKLGFDPKQFTLGLQKFTDYHLGSVPGSPALEPRSRPAYSYILSGIALIVLLLACFNYMNLSIGQSSTRFKEIGIRKVMGAHRGRLIKQFLMDPMLLSFMALFLGLALAELFLPKFNTLSGKSLSLDYLESWQNLLVLIGLTVFIGMVSGSYPAFVLSRMNAVDIFKGKSKMGGKNIFTRFLIVLQFSVSIFLIIGILIIANQLNFLKTRELGYDRENVLAIPTQSFLFRNSPGEDVVEYLKKELRHQPNILSISGVAGWSGNPVGFSNRRPLIQDNSEIRVHFKKVDYNYLETMGISLIQGRNFSPNFSTDISEAAIVNEAFVKQFKLKEPIGKRFFEFCSDPHPERYRKNQTIIGVIRNYHFTSLHNEIAPLVLNLDRDVAVSVVLAKIKSQNFYDSIALLKTKWNEIRPDMPFMYFFLDDLIDMQYQREQNWSWIIGYSTGFAVFIACMGLFGLTALAVVQRTKEIGIRKVLGAQVPGIVLLLSKEFVLLISLANIIAWPIAYFAMNKWLQNFAFRIHINIWTFVISAAMALLIGIVTVGYQAVKTATANPVDSLRYE